MADAGVCREQSHDQLQGLIEQVVVNVNDWPIPEFVVDVVRRGICEVREEAGEALAAIEPQLADPGYNRAGVASVSEIAGRVDASN